MGNQNEEMAMEVLGGMLKKYGYVPINREDKIILRRAVNDIYSVMQEYHGHPNYETWAVSLWLSNDYSIYNHIKNDIVEGCKRDAEEDSNVKEGIWTKKESVKYCVADGIKDMVGEDEPDMEASVWSDFLSASLSEVDWDDVADGFLEE